MKKTVIMLILSALTTNIMAQKKSFRPQDVTPSAVSLPSLPA